MAGEHPSAEWTSPEGVHTVRVETTAYYAVEPVDPSISTGTTLCVLHGWGQRSVSFIRRFGPLRDAGIAVVSPQAPHQTYLDMETRKVGFSWLTNYDRDRAVPDLVIGIDSVLDDVERTHGPLGRLFVLGFSQGVSVAYRYALRSTRTVSGVIACGGDLPPDVSESLPSRAAFPVLIVHGRDDAIVPAEKGEAAYARLQSLNWPVEQHLFEGGHEIPAATVESIGGWIARVP